jgi:AraC-like DNA-binding protein
MAENDLIRWYLWEGGFLALGKADVLVPMHAHHAVQIVISFDIDLAIRGSEGDWRTGRGVIVPPDLQHSFDGRGMHGAMLFVDPESAEGIWLRTTLGRQIVMVPEARLTSCVAGLRTFRERPFESVDVASVIRNCVQSLCAGAPPSRRLDERVSRVLEVIRASDDLRMSLERAAAMAFLSPSRFAHLFKQQVGLPFRRYMLWRKLTRAVVAIGREPSIAAAAHASDFADAAHLTRTFYQMFGLPPSVMLRGEFFEVPPPFEGGRV